ncbi:hypothetical protein MASR2M36_36780 [Providencia sp.]
MVEREAVHAAVFWAQLIADVIDIPIVTHPASSLWCTRRGIAWRGWQTAGTQIRCAKNRMY